MTQDSADEENYKAQLEEIRNKKQKEIARINKILSHFDDELWKRSCFDVCYEILMAHDRSMT